MDFVAHQEAAPHGLEQVRVDLDVAAPHGLGEALAEGGARAELVLRIRTVEQALVLAREHISRAGAPRKQRIGVEPAGGGSARDAEEPVGELLVAEELVVAAARAVGDAPPQHAEEAGEVADGGSRAAVGGGGRRRRRPQPPQLLDLGGRREPELGELQHVFQDCLARREAQDRDRRRPHPELGAAPVLRRELLRDRDRGDRLAGACLPLDEQARVVGVGAREVAHERLRPGEAQAADEQGALAAAEAGPAQRRRRRGRAGASIERGAELPPPGNVGQESALVARVDWRVCHIIKAAIMQLPLAKNAARRSERQKCCRN